MAATQLFLILALLIQSKFLDVKLVGTLIVSVAKTLRRQTQQRLILANIFSMSMNVLLRTPSSSFRVTHQMNTDAARLKAAQTIVTTAMTVVILAA